MPLTKEQFQSARDAGFSVDQIINFEKQRNPELTKLRDSIATSPTVQYAKSAYEQLPFVKGIANRINPSADKIMSVIPDAQGIPAKIASSIPGLAKTALAFEAGAGPLGLAGGSAAVGTEQALTDKAKGASTDQALKNGLVTSAGVFAGGKILPFAGKTIASGARAIKTAVGDVSKSASNYVTDVVAPKAYQAYQDSVSKFTPQIQKFAEDKLKIPESAINSIKKFGTDAINNSTETLADVSQKISGSIEQLKSNASAVYKSAMDSVPDNFLFKINGTFNTLGNTLKRMKLVDLQGNVTSRGNNADPVYKSLITIYQDMQKSLVYEGKKQATGAIPKSDFEFYRDSLSRLYKDSRSDRTVKNIIDALYNDADSAGFQGLKEARSLYRKASTIADNYENSALVKEGKLGRYHKLTADEMSQLREIEKATGTSFMNDLEKASAKQYVDKLQSYNMDKFVSDLNTARNDKGQINYIQKKYEDILGKDNAKKIFDDIRSGQRGSLIKKAAAGVIGVGAADAGLGYIKGKIRGSY